MLKLLKFPFWQTADVSSHDAMLRYIQSEDAKWLEALVHQHQTALYRFLVQQSDPQLAADICQQTWLKLIEKKHLYTEQYQFKPWLYRIARNLLVDEFRRSNKLVFDNEIELAGEGERDVAILAEQLDCLDVDIYQQALSQLKFSQRESLILQLQGFSLHQISEIVAQPQETVKSRIRYAKQALKQILANRLKR